MYRKSKKVIEREAWVDEYILLNGFPPSYNELAAHFKIGESVAWYACKKFRHKMRERTNDKIAIINLNLKVPADKAEEVNVLILKIKSIISGV